MPPLNLQAVKASMLEKLAKSALTAAHAKKLKLEPMTEEQAQSAGINPAWAGFKIPYFHLDGSIDSSMFRYRFWPESRPSKGFAAIADPTKPLRYVQPKGTEPGVYLPPLLSASWADIVEDRETTLFITEGELKSACGCSIGMAMLGLGGVFSWTSKRLKMELIPALEAFTWLNRSVYLCFDSDKSSKPLVQLAASRLAVALANRGALVHDVDLTPAADGSKRGVDDIIAGEGGQEELNKLILPTDLCGQSLELHKLNAEVAVIWKGGATGNVVRIEDGAIMTAERFTRSLYRDRTYMEFGLTASGQPAAPKRKQAAEEWLAWPKRAQVGLYTYVPGIQGITPSGDFSKWRATGAVPAKGDRGPWEDLLSRVLRGASQEHVLWFKRWLAWPLQHPGAKMFSCTVLWSHKGGTGKNLLAESMVPVYGESNCVTIKSRHLTSDFNGWAEGVQWVIGDEITLDDKRHTSGDLKSTLTNRTIRVNKKGIEAYEVPDCANYFFTSNDPVSIVLDQGERRTFVHHVPEEPIGDAYGANFAAWLRSGGAAHIAWYLTEELNMGDFSPTAAPPDTDAKLELISNSRSEVDTWAAALRLDPAAMLAPKDTRSFSGPAPPLKSVYTPEDLLRVYDPEGRQRTSLRALGIALDRAGFVKARHNNGRLGNVRSTFWVLDWPEGREPPSSVTAAKMYVAERPDFRAGAAGNNGHGGSKVKSQ